MRSEDKIQIKKGIVTRRLGAIMSRGFIRATKQVTMNCEQYCSEPLLAEAIMSHVIETLSYVAFSKLGEVQDGIEEALRRFAEEVDEDGRHNWKYHEEAILLGRQIDETVKEELKKKLTEMYTTEDLQQYIWWDPDEEVDFNDRAVRAFVLDEIEWAIKQHFFNFVEYAIDKMFREVGLVPYLPERR